MNLAESKAFFDENGYAIVKGLFSPQETAFYRDHFMDVRQRGTYPGDFTASVPREGDPLLRFPRLIHMHRWDDASKKWLLDQRLNRCLTAFYDGVEPLAVQTMLYFKPPGARGQALHQDNFYLKVKPGTCMAAWMALDNCDVANGCIRVVPGSHRWPMLCTTQADTKESFTDVTVPIPAEQEIVNVLMEAGDVLFFHGALVHGSLPNTSDRFRRALIGHYINGHAEQTGAFYHPILRMDGSEWKLAQSPGGGPCGVWVDHDGKAVLELTGAQGGPAAAHE